MSDTHNPEVKIKEEALLDDVFADEWRATFHNNDFLKPQESKPIDMTKGTYSGFGYDLCGTSFDSSDLDTKLSLDTGSSTCGDSFLGSETTFLEKLEDAYGKKLQACTDAPHTSITRPSLDDYASPSPAYVPSLPVSPQDLFLDKTALVYTSSPDLSTQDGYSSSDDAFSRYASEPPAHFLPAEDVYASGSLPATESRGRWWPHSGLTYPRQPQDVATSAPSCFYNAGDGEMLARRQPLLRYPRPTYYAAAEPDQELNMIRQRDEQNRFLVSSRLMGMSYKEIREIGGFREAESTLRGRFRDLTKRKHERVRKPVWTRHDVKLLTEFVDPVLCDCSQRSRASRLELEALLSRVSWKKVSAHIVDNGGSYRYGSATCKKKYMELQGMF